MMTIRSTDTRLAAASTYHAEAGWQTCGWRGEAIEAAIRLDIPRHSDGARISSAAVVALGLRILRAQRRDLMRLAQGDRRLAADLESEIAVGAALGHPVPSAHAWRDGLRRS